MYQEYLDEGKERMDGAIRSLDSDLASFRTGRANPQILDRVRVEVYGSFLPLNQVAIVSAPEAQQLAIRPFDVTSMPSIERAILESNLGLNPNNDGKIIRLNIPRLNEERRRDLGRMVGKRVEEAKVAVRNVRRDVQNDIRELKEEKIITEDDERRGHEKLQELTDRFVKQIDDRGKEKTAEIMEV